MNLDTQELLEHCFDYAEELIIDTGEFYPFGAFLYTGNDNNVHPLEFEPDKKNMPKVGLVLESLKKYCSSEMEQGNIRAFALVCEAEVAFSETEKKKCIQIEITNPNHPDVPLFYKEFTGINGNAQFGEPFAVSK